MEAGFMVEMDLNVMTRQYFSYRIASIEKIKCELPACESKCKCNTVKIQWYFQTGDVCELILKS